MPKVSVNTTAEAVGEDPVVKVTYPLMSDGAVASASVGLVPAPVPGATVGTGNSLPMKWLALKVGAVSGS